MKGLLLKFIAGQSLRLGLAYALQAVSGSIAALRGVLEHGNISDEARGRIEIILEALSAIRDFLSKAASLIGSPSLSQSSSALEEAARKLRTITEGM
jgi:predicted RNA binding protein with dsRBD fold (UPF0201 family)